MISGKILYSVVVWVAGLVLLSACAAPTRVETSEELGELAQVDFAEVEVGQGSPTPVAVTVDVSFDKACTQISSIEQSMVKDGDTTKIQLEVRVAEMGETCIDFPQSFRLVLPINASGLPKGVYAVEVNGVDAGQFEFKN